MAHKLIRGVALKCLNWGQRTCAQAASRLECCRKAWEESAPGKAISSASPRLNSEDAFNKSAGKLDTLTANSPDAGYLKALKDAERKLAQEKELLRTLLENVPDSIYFKDLQSRFVCVSRFKALRILQLSPKARERLAQLHDQSPSPECDAMVGLSDFDTYTEEHARPAFADEQAIIRSGEPVIGKLEKLTFLDGSVSWSLTTKLPWRDKEGKTIGTFGISRDITALKKAETDLEAAHKRLVETSRLAGMAEVATDVLHDVGNTLNSINVSCSLALDRVKQLNLTNLGKVAELLEHHVGQLEFFLTQDPQGKHIPVYLKAITQRCQEHQSFLLQELEQLRRHIDHVNLIVAMQQNYAKVAGLEEVIDLAHLLDDACQINAAALDRHKVIVKREIEPAPQVLVDKHKVLQILVNLIRNAKYALSESAAAERILTLRIKRHEPDQVLIQVADNGVGIAAENLTRIFSHGFTTRQNGHGFGLHSGALAARELGGSLSVYSAGLNQGATFTLALPLKQHPQPAIPCRP